ncbi:MAG: Rrf2 family transcriptional regulator [Firmicutes bacterium]|jgi:Rrf2 family protein|nr:Rrf2 family transcriptional regulator [Bacillota bacterium]NLL89146.1 Rrf2 family transcriptional regulator [Bacillota bacterium]HKM17937.1 Rrf2 family transcriptional regulator [Limnochordia bacterium]
MEITKKAEYAISALLELAMNPGQYISSKEIASRQNIPANFLPQIVALLGNRGWVEGMRGPGGGVRLIGDPRKISVLEIVELIEGRIAITKCLSVGGSCSREDNCPLNPVWKKVQNAMLAVLSHTTLADVLELSKIKENEHNRVIQRDI